MTLIERLREPLDKRLPLRVHNERREAADEIERLQAGVISLRIQYDELADKNERLQKLYDVAVADRVRMHEEIKNLKSEIDTDRVQNLMNLKRKDAEIERLRAALERIAEEYLPDDSCDDARMFQDWAREALRDDD